MATDPMISESAAMFGELIHKLLKQGGMRVAITDEDGRVVGVEMVDFTPAMLGKFETYLHHWGMSSAKSGDLARGGASPETIARARERAGLKLTAALPPLSDKDDAATAPRSASA